jgi:hypothetical protein
VHSTNRHCGTQVWDKKETTIDVQNTIAPCTIIKSSATHVVQTISRAAATRTGNYRQESQSAHGSNVLPWRKFLHISLSCTWLCQHTLCLTILEIKIMPLRTFLTLLEQSESNMFFSVILVTCAGYYAFFVILQWFQKQTFLS